MSARRLQQPPPVSASTCMALGTSIVTTLAILPHGGANLPKNDPQSQGEASAGQHERVSVGDQIKVLLEQSAGGACGSNTTSRLPINLSVDQSPDHFLAEGNILADFNGSHVPNFIKAETRIDYPNVPAVREILAAYEGGFPTEALMKANFPGGDFQYHLMAYLRNRMRISNSRREGSLETRLLDAYITGVKEWCAAALDVFISQVEGLTTQVESSEVADGQGRKPVLWTHQFFFETAALQQRRALKTLGERTYKDSVEWQKKWIKRMLDHKLTRYEEPASLKLAGKSDAICMNEELRFISEFLRNMTPKDFIIEASTIARILKCYGAPSQLVDLLLYMHLRPEGAEHKRVKPAQGLSTVPLAERVDMHASISHLRYPLSVLDPDHTYIEFSHEYVPPLLQQRHEVENFKMEAIIKIIELYKRAEYDEALSVMDQEFDGAQEFHEHVFGLVKTAMRSYVLPKSSEGAVDSEAGKSYDLNKSLEQLLQYYILGVHRWCARAHEILTEEIEKDLTALHQSDTEASKEVIKWVCEMEPTYTQNVKRLMDQIDPSMVHPEQSSPPDTEIAFCPPVAQVRKNIHKLNWLVQNMPWDCFLFFRTDLASLVREVNKSKDFSFLANILEDFSIAEDDIKGLKKYFYFSLRRFLERYAPGAPEFEIEMSQELSLRAPGANRR